MVHCVLAFLQALAGVRLCEGGRLGPEARGCPHGGGAEEERRQPPAHARLCGGGRLGRRLPSGEGEGPGPQAQGCPH